VEPTLSKRILTMEKSLLELEGVPSLVEGIPESSLLA
jgi:hypothetical protein